MKAQRKYLFKKIKLQVLLNYPKFFNKIITLTMKTVLDHYNPHSTQSKLEWHGLKSQRFGRTKEFLPKRDCIQRGLDIPLQNSARGRKHLEQQNSKEKQFRSIVKIMPKIDHWHPRESKKKVYQMSFTQAIPRRQKGHKFPQFLNPQKTAGIRTFYNTRVRENNERQYSLEDRMQRKSRVDQYELRRTFFANN